MLLLQESNKQEVIAIRAVLSFFLLLRINTIFVLLTELLRTLLHMCVPAKANKLSSSTFLRLGKQEQHNRKLTPHTRGHLVVTGTTRSLAPRQRLFMRGCFRRFHKALQRGSLSFLNTPGGAAFTLLAALLLVSIAVQLLDTSSYGTGYVCLESIVSSSPLAHTPRHDYADNIAGRSFESALCEEPIDAVYTWVNGSEPQHQLEVSFWQLLQRKEFSSVDDLAAGADANLNTTDTSTETPRPTLSAEQLDDQSGRSRFEDHDELRYSLRSLEMYAGWVRRIYIVTNGQVPTWLDMSNPRVTIITHASLFPNKSHLPTFSSPAIESHLHRIPGLSRRFLYLNDDTMFGAPVTPADFYSRTKGQRLFYSWPVPQCSDGCPAAWLGDGTCDRQCNVTSCDYDAGDCIGPNVRVLGATGGGGHAAVPTSRGTPPKQSNTHCNGNCADGWIGDRYCDASCNHPDCGYDGMDCGLSAYEEVAFLKFHPSSPLSGMNASRPAKTTTLGDREKVALAFHFMVDVSKHKAFLVNLSTILPASPLSAAGRGDPYTFSSGRITSGEFDTPSWVRSATISQANKAMVVSIVSEWHTFARTAHFAIDGERTVDFQNPKVPNVQQSVRIMLNITLFNGTSSSSSVPDDTRRRHMTHSVTIRQPVLSDDEMDLTDGHVPWPNPSDREDYHAPSPSSQRRLLEAAQEEAAMRSAWASSDGYLLHTTISAALPEEESEDRRAAPSSSSPPSTQRRLLDLFGDSLKHTNMLLNRRFKSTSRRVPAHMVHMIHRDVMNELWERWPEEWEATSASKFRSRSNLQYAFMHYYWMVHAHDVISAEKVFESILDVDGSGLLERREVRRFALLLWEKEVPLGSLDSIAKDIVRGCEMALAMDRVVDAASTPSARRAELETPINTTTSALSDNQSSVWNDTLTNTSAEASAPHRGNPVVHDLPLGEPRSTLVCRAVLLLPTTKKFVQMIHPPPPPPPTSPPSTSEAPSMMTHDTTTLHGPREFHNRTTSRSRHRSNSSAARVHNQPSLVSESGAVEAAAPTTTVAPRAVYRVPSLNPEDKIRPMTPDFFNTVEWLIRAAALGVAAGGEQDEPDERSALQRALRDASTMVEDAPFCASAGGLSELDAAWRRRVLMGSTEGGTNRMGKVMSLERWADCHLPSAAVADPIPLSATTFASSHIGAILSDKYNSRKKYKVTIEELEDVTFVMVRNNRTVVQHQMDHVLYKRPKFLCVNDDMNHTSADYLAILDIVKETFQAYYPLPSSFELPEGKRNPFTRLSPTTQESAVELVDDFGDGAQRTSGHILRFQDAVRLLASVMCLFCAAVLLRAWSAVRMQAAFPARP